MKILNLKVSGFRSLKDITWTPGDLNVVIGPNGSGKSNLLSLLELISISAQGRLGKHVQQSGGMEPLVWDGRSDRIAFAFNTVLTHGQGVSEGDRLTYHVEMLRLGMGSTFRVDRERLDRSAPVSSAGPPQSQKLLEREGLKALAFVGDHGEGVDAWEGWEQEGETALSQSRIDPVFNPFRAYLEGWSVHQDIHVNRDAPIRQAVVTRLDKRIDPDGQNLISVLHTHYTGDRVFEKGMDSAMRAAFGNDYDKLVFPPAADQRIQLRVRWKTLQREIPAADLSDGTLRFLFLMTVLASPSPAPLIAIDEPETGLHPSMFPVVAEYAVDAADRTQVVFTTHSPQFLDAFHDVKPTTTVAKWEGGETHLTTLEAKELGPWLKEFSLGSLFRSGELEGMA